MLLDPTLTRQLQVNLHRVARHEYKTVNTVNYKPTFWVVSHQVRGEMDIITGGEKYFAKSGDIMIHPPKMTYSKFTQKEGLREYIVVEANFWSHIEMLRFYPLPPVIPLKNPGEFSAIFEELHNLWFSSKQLYNIQIFALTLNLLNVVITSWQEAGSPPRSTALKSSQDRFTAVINYMSDNLDKKIKRDELADLVHLNPRYFDRLFNQSYGVAPTQMLRELRLGRAKRLLETSNIPLAHIATACGFNEAAHFIRTFHKYVGITPTKYRKNVKRET